MINNLREEITRQIEKEYKYIYKFKIENTLLELLILKYYCDKQELSYQELIKKDSIKEIKIPTKNIEYIIPHIKNIRLLSLIQYENLKDLIKEYINEKTLGINIINSNEKKLCISKNIINNNTCLYDITSTTSYLFDNIDNYKYDIAIYQFFDLVLDNDNKYLELSTLSDEALKEYKYVYIFDNIPKYRYIKYSENDQYELIKKLFQKNKNLKVILQTNYKKISNIKDSIFILKYMSKVLLYDDIKCFIYYENKSDENISIINYNKNKIKSLNRLFEIIKNNRKQKDILVKTTITDIKNNRYRIGFKLYQSNVEESIRNINEIVDENTRLIKRLSDINTEIEEEINDLINR